MNVFLSSNLYFETKSLFFCQKRLKHTEHKPFMTIQFCKKKRSLHSCSLYAKKYSESDERHDYTNKH